ncbi:sigma-70 family RNA polymerase sigma factor [Thermodesulfitimonas autotrophica]|nr:sigma-70 family RNA polymerase sigma factor [Thermodesulfitimonas autotrophica]
MTEAWVEPPFAWAFLRWAAARAEALRDPAISREDLEQEARIALWQACKTYDPALSSLKTWCKRHVEFAVRAFLRVQSRKGRVFQRSLDEPVDEKERRTLGETVPCSVAPAEDSLSDTDFLRWLIRELDLTPLESLALRVHLLGGSYREVEEATGISWKSLDNAWQRVRRKAQKLMEGAEISG